MSRIPRPRIELEERLVSEYMVQHHAGARHMIRVRLGPLPPEAKEAITEGLPATMYGVTRHWADAVAIYPDRIVLIEAKIKLRADAVGQLLIYEQLLPNTPELMPYASRNHELEIIYVQGDPDVEAYCRQTHINCIRFAPEWAVQAYLARARRIYGAEVTY